MSGFLDKFYNRSPWFIQDLMVTIYGVMLYRREYGGKFRDLLDEFEKRQWLSHGDIVEYQNQRLRLLIGHCYENVPYYRKVMDDRGLKPSDIAMVNDLCKLPVLTRDDVRANLEALTTRSPRRSKYIIGHTSGTTGAPLELRWDDRICFIKTVVDWRQKRIAGINPGDPMAFFLGRTVAPLDQKKPPFWRHNRVMNQLFCSSWHLSAENLEAYFSKLERFRPLAIEGYPSTMSILAGYLVSRKKTFPLKAAFTSSETLMPSQREMIERAFACRLFDFYGMAERVAFSTECEEHDGKHLNLDFSVMEVLDKDGNPAAGGQIGRVVATGLHNLAMPLIRYQTSDVTALRGVPCKCGRGFPLMENITTKDEDIVSTRDGRYISSSILNALTHHLTSLTEHQVVQEDRDRVVMKIVRRPNYTQADEDFLLRELRRTLGEGMTVELEYVDAIPRTAAGKFRWVISKVPLEF